VEAKWRAARDQGTWTQGHDRQEDHVPEEGSRPAYATLQGQLGGGGTKRTNARAKEMRGKKETDGDEGGQQKEIEYGGVRGGAGGGGSSGLLDGGGAEAVGGADGGDAQGLQVAADLGPSRIRRRNVGWRDRSH
jgi:hypothetical protein